MSCCTAASDKGRQNGHNSRNAQLVDEDYPEPRGKNRSISRFGAEHKQQQVSRFGNGVMELMYMCGICDLVAAATGKLLNYPVLATCC